MARRRGGGLAAGLATGPRAGHGRRLAVAQVRVISPTATGGPGQNFRFYADNLKDTFGQSFVLENMPGGSGSVGCMAVARAAPDGHTLLLASNSHIVLAPLVLTGSPVNVKRDFAPIALMFTFPFLLVVNADLGREDAEGAGRLRQGAAGPAQLGLARRRHRRPSGDRAAAQAHRHPGPARALSRHDAAIDGGRRGHPAVHLRHARQCDAACATPARSSRSAVTGAKRSVSAPEVPTFRELGYDGFDDLHVANGLLAPIGTPTGIIEALDREMVKPEHQRDDPRPAGRCVLRSRHISPEQYGAMIDRELTQWGAIVQRNRRAGENVTELPNAHSPRLNSPKPTSIRRSTSRARAISSSPRAISRGAASSTPR